MNINEIFTSLSGEADGFNNQGGLATFVRLQGCNLECKWCDTEPTRRPMPPLIMSVEDVAEACKTKHVVITGGEPLLQSEEVKQLISLLCPYGRSNHLITIETNGSIPITISPAHERYETLRWVVDYKLSSSGMTKSMIPSVFDYLFELDVIKFVIKDLPDYRQAKELVLKNQQWSAKKVFSPILGGKIDNTKRYSWAPHLATEMIEDSLEGVTFSMQLHKLLDLR